MATLYLTGLASGATAATWNTLSHWRTESATPGIPSSTAPSALPTASDDVVVYKTGASGALTVTMPTTAQSLAVCRNISVGSAAGLTTLTFSGSSNGITVSGNMILTGATSVVWSSTGTLTFNGTASSYNINTNMGANLIAAAVVFNGSATTTFNLLSAFRVSNASGVTLTQGILSLGINNILVSTVFASSGVGTRTLDFGSGSTNMSLSGASPWNVSSSGLSIIGTPTVNLTYSTTGTRTITLSALNASTPTNYPIFVFSGTASGTLTFTGGGSCYIQGTTSPSSITISGSTTVTITSSGFTSGTAALILSSGNLTVASTSSFGAITIDSGSILDISASGVVLTASTIGGSSSGTIKFPASGTNLVLNSSGSVWNFSAGTYTLTGVPNVSLTYSSSATRTIILTGTGTSNPPKFIFSGTASGALTFTGGNSCYIEGTSSPSSVTINSSTTVNITSNGFTSGGAVLSLSGSGRLNLAGAASFAAVTIDTGTLDISASGGVLTATTATCTTSGSIIFPSSFSGTYNLVLSTSGTIWNFTGSCTFTGIPRVKSSFTSSTAITINNSSSTAVPIFSFSGTGTTTVIGNVGLAAGSGSWIGAGSITVGSTGGGLVGNLYVIESLSMGSLNHIVGTIDLETYNVSITAKEYANAAVNSFTRTLKFGTTSSITLINSGTTLSSSPFSIQDATTAANLTFSGAGNPVFRFTATAAISIYTADYATGSKYPYFLMDAVSAGTFSVFSIGTPVNPSYVGTTTNNSFAGLTIGSSTYTGTNVALVSVSVNEISLNNSCLCTGTFTFTAGKLVLSADLSCSTFVSSGTLTRDINCGYSKSITISGSGTIFAPSTTNLTVSGGTGLGGVKLFVKSTYTGSNAISITGPTILQTDGYGVFPVFVFAQGSSPASTITLTGTCRIACQDSNNKVSSLVINGDVYLHDNFYCSGTTFHTSSRFRLYDLYEGTSGGKSYYTTAYSVTSGATGAGLDFGNLGVMYINPYLTSTGTLFSINSTNSNFSMFSAGTVVFNANYIAGIGYGFGIDLTAFSGNSAMYFKVYGSAGNSFNLSGRVAGLNFDSNVGRFNGTLTVTPVSYVYGDLIFSSTMSLPNGSSNILTVIGDTNNLTLTCPNNLTFPLDVSASGIEVIVTTNLSCTYSISISAAKTRLQCNTVFAGGITMYNISLEPPISGGTTTFTSSTSSNFYISPYYSQTNPVEINITGVSQSIYSGFSQANLNLTYGAAYTFPSISGYYNNITGAIHTPTFTGTTYVYGTINVANIIQNSTAYFYQNIITGDITGTGSSNYYASVNCNTLTVSTQNFYTGSNTNTLTIRSQTGSLNCGRITINPSTTANGTILLLSNITIANSTSYKTSGSAPDLSILSGKIDFNRYNVQLGWTFNNSGTIDLNGGILTIYGTYGLYGSGSFELYYNDGTNIYPCNIFSSSTGSKIQFYGSAGSYSSSQTISGGSTSDFSNISIELYSTNITNYSFSVEGQTLNNIKNMNTTRKTINFFNSTNPATPVNVKNLELNDCILNNRDVGGNRPIINYIGQSYINLSNTYIANTIATPLYPGNKFIALTSNLNQDLGNNDGIVFNYKFDGRFLETFE